jgi:hypothetical protein
MGDLHLRKSSSFIIEIWDIIWLKKSPLVSSTSLFVLPTLGTMRQQYPQCLVAYGNKCKDIKLQLTDLPKNLSTSTKDSIQ